MEKLYDLERTGRYDLIVIDTPPTRNALDFLDAPRRLTDFLEGRFLRMFLAPGMAAGRLATRAVGLGTGMFMRAASRITGAGVLDDLALFFQSMDGMYEGFKNRAQAVYELLQSPGSGFVVVASPEPPALREARFFLERLTEDGMPTAGVVVNRVTPPPRDDGLATLDVSALRRAAAALVDDGPERQAAAALLHLHLARRDVATRENRAVTAALQDMDVPVLLDIPLMATDVHDLPGLRVVAGHLTGERS